MRHGLLLDDDTVVQGYDLRLLRRLLSYARPHWRGIVACLVLLAGLAAIDIAIPYATKVAIDRCVAPAGRVMGGMGDAERRAVAHAGARGAPPTTLSTPTSPSLPEGDLEARRALLSTIAVAILALLVLQGGLSFAQALLINYIGQRAMYDLRHDLFVHYQALGLSFYDRNPVGRLVTRVTNDVAALQEFFTGVLVPFFKDVVMLGGIVAVMLWLDMGMALVCFALVPPLLVVTFVFRRMVREVWRRLRRQLAHLNAFVEEYLSGIRVVHAFHRGERTQAQFEVANDEYFRLSREQINLYALYHPVVAFLSSVGLAALYWHGGGRVVQGALTFGTLVAFVNYLEMFFRPIRDLSEKYTIVQSAFAAAERVFQLLDTHEYVRAVAAPAGEMPAAGAAAAPTDLRADLEFRDVWFAYRPEEWVLKGVSFRVAPGQSLALVGHTGAGKTTVINLLMRHYDHQRGQILVDGRDIRGLDPEALRRRFGCVRQDVFAFSGTVEDNVRLRDRTLTREAVVEAARFVNAERFIEALPRGYDTEVHEGGQALSSGQRQLLAFARALVRRPAVLLLDEATSSVDTRTEHEIQVALERMLCGFTSVVVAHRLSTIRQASRIVVLHRGEVRESGTHEELMRQEGLYWRLYLLAAGRGAERGGADGTGVAGQDAVAPGPDAANVAGRAAVVYRRDRALYVNLTNRCSNRCAFCVADRDESLWGYRLRLRPDEAEPTAAEVTRAVRAAGAFDELVFCGYGEPLMRASVIVEVLRALGLPRSQVRINTNGQLRAPSGLLEDLAPLVGRLSVSLNAPDAESYERLCRPAEGGAAYQTVLDFIAAARERFEVTATAVDAPGVDLEGTARVARGLGVPFRVRHVV